MGDAADARVMALKIVRMTDGDAARSPLRAWRAGDRDLALAALEAPDGAALADEASRLIDLALDADPALARRIGAALAAWDDDVAAYRELKRVVEGLIDRSGGLAPIRWAPHAATIACISEPYLRARPHEPTMLAYAGLALLGLNRAKLSVRLFEAASALDPTVQGVAASLRMARERGARPISQPLPPDLRARVAIAEAGLDDVARRAGSLPKPGRNLALHDRARRGGDAPRLPALGRAAVDEMIVVDTGSTTAPSRSPRASARRSCTSPGRAVLGARNHGLDAATGDYIFWLDADERLEQRRRRPDARAARGRLARGRWLVETNFTGQDEIGHGGHAHGAAALPQPRQLPLPGAIHEQIRVTMPTTSASASRPPSSASAITATSSRASTRATSTTAT